MKSDPREIAVITGAGSGTGRALAIEAARRGAGVAILDNDAKTLEETAATITAMGREVHAECLDVADAQRVAAFAQEVLDRFGQVDLLVNNAGVAVAGEVLQIPLEAWHWVMNVNLWGAIHTIHAFLPAMIAQGRGRIVNVASVNGLLGVAALVPYTVTKYGLVGLSESLRSELSPLGIQVNVVCPGLMATNLARNVRFFSDRIPWDPAAVAPLMQRYGMPPEKVARRIFRGIERNRPIITLGYDITLLYWLKRTFPRLFDLGTRFVGKRIATIFTKIRDLGRRHA